MKIRTLNRSIYIISLIAISILLTLNPLLATKTKNTSTMKTKTIATTVEDLDSFLSKESDETDDEDDAVDEDSKQQRENREMQFLQLRLNRKNKKPNKDAGLTYAINPDKIKKPKETDIARYKAYRTNLKEKLVKGKKFTTSLSERLSESYKKFRYSNGEQSADDFVSFLTYLKDASNRANKRSEVINLKDEGEGPVSIPKVRTK